MASNQPLRRLSIAFVNVEAMPDSHHDSQQQERERNAQHGKDAPPLVAKSAFGHEAGYGHMTPRRLTS
jgi:hypothetical protein